MLVNIICALVGAIFGSWIGHLFTIKLYREKTTKQKKALYEEVCSGQLKLATFLAFTQYRRSDSLGVRPPLYQCGLSWL
ncbi:Uncharacterised protein [Vibrio paracholerae]|nr:Uncharacterised protein [Vibrio paracholerae]